MVAGGNLSGNGGNASFTMVFMTGSMQNHGNGSFTVGVQQPFELLSTQTESEVYDWLDEKLSVYPNPASNYIFLKIPDRFYDQQVTYSYDLRDITGKIIISGTLINNPATIDLSYLNPSIYFLRVFNKSRESETFKIIKNQ
jgi:hypothetical protein